jgi:hypothetical protein
VLSIDVNRPPNSVFTISMRTRSGFDRAMPTLPILKYVWVESGLSMSSSLFPCTGGASATATAGAAFTGVAANTAASCFSISAAA